MSENVQLDFSVLKKTITWWEKKRIWFNVAVGITGTLGVIVNIIHPFGIDDFIGIVLWGIMANILYSVGILLEIVNQYYLKGKLNIFRFRHFFFIIGTLAYVFFSWVYAHIYYIYPYYMTPY